MKRAVLAALLLCVAVYAGDYLSVKFRIPNREPVGMVKVERYYAVPQKGNKTEFYFDQPENRACVNSLFPHFGDSPCWYVNRHKRERINM